MTGGGDVLQLGANWGAVAEEATRLMGKPSASEHDCR